MEDMLRLSRMWRRLMCEWLLMVRRMRRMDGLTLLHIMLLVAIVVRMTGDGYIMVQLLWR